jgi:L-malate glycosyltransferase
MRIIHLDSGKSWRGGQQQVHLLAQGLKSRSLEQWLLVQRSGALGAQLRDSSLPFEELGFTSEVSPRALFQLCKVIQRFQPTLLHAHDSRTLGLAALAKRITPGWKLVASRRVVFSIRSNPLWRVKYVWSVDRIIAISAQVRNGLIQDGVPASKISLVYDGFVLKPSPLSQSRELSRKRWGIEADHFLVGSVGSLTREKGHEHLIAAWPEIQRKLPAARLLLVGDGPLRSRLENLVNERHLRSSVVFAGFQTHLEEVWPALDLLVFPSLEEGLGSTLLSAMGQHIPVCASRTGGIPEVVKDGETGILFPPANPQAISAAVIRLSLERELVPRLIRTAFSYVQEHFQVEQMVAGTYNVYAEVLRS